MKGEVIILIQTCIFLGFEGVFAIDCYVCSSQEGRNRDCEDHFKKNLRTSVFIARKCDFGYFKATHCVKLKGTREDGTSILVRQCSNGDWGSHCGDIKYEIGDKTETVDGCLETCDFDGCNSSVTVTVSRVLLILSLVSAFLYKQWIV